jgi:hypothetical protein
VGTTIAEYPTIASFLFPPGRQRRVFVVGVVAARIGITNAASFFRAFAYYFSNSAILSSMHTKPAGALTAALLTPHTTTTAKIAYKNTPPLVFTDAHNRHSP